MDIKVLVALAALLCAIAVGFVLRLTGNIFIPLLIAWFMLQVFRPVIALGRKIKLPPFVNTALVFAVFFSLCYIGIMFFITQVVEFHRIFGQYQSKLYEMTMEIMKVLQIPPESLPRITWMDIVGRYLQNIWEITLDIASKFALTLIFFFFMLMESPYLNNKIDRAFSCENANKLKNIVSSISIDTSRYLGTLFLISMVTGALVWLILEVMGVELAIGWGVLAFLLNFIPTVGSIVATVPPVMMAVLQFSPGYVRPAMVLLLLFAVQFGIGNFVTPKLVGDKLGLSPVVIMLSLMLWGTIWGLPGAILSVPIAAIVKIVCENFESLKPIAVMMGTGKKVKHPTPEPAEPETT